MTAVYKVANLLFTASRGGLEQAYINYTRALQSYGHEVECFIHPEAPYSDEIVASGAKIHHLSPLGFFDPFALWKFRRWLLHSRIDIILAHNGRAASLAARAARGTGITTIGVSHGYKTKYFRRCDGVIVLGQDMLEHFATHGFSRDRLRIVTNMIDLHELHVKRGHDYLHDATINHVPIIAAAGRLSPEKGFDVLLEALAVIKRKGLHFKAGIAGDGALKVDLQQQINKLGLEREVTLAGWVSDLRSWLSQADIMCVPSREESFGMVILEAFAAGIPVVATDAPGPLEILSGGGGETVARNDHNALAETIMHILRDHKYWQKLRQDGWDNLKNYDRRKVSDNLQQAISYFSSQRLSSTAVH